MNFVAEMTLRDLSAHGVEPMPMYRHALESACDVAAPPFGTRRYGETFRRAATDPAWIAESLITSAEREADGAQRLWSLAASTADPDISRQVKQHAIDEARHSRWYAAVLELVFPGAIAPELREYLNRLSPGYRLALEPVATEGSPFAHSLTIDDLVQMNIAEIRTAINQRLQRPVLLACCDSRSSNKLLILLDRLLKDEIRHVAYSARLIERLSSQDTEVLDDLMLTRLRQFNEITCEEVEERVFPLHCSRQECRNSDTCIGTSGLS